MLEPGWAATPGRPGLITPTQSTTPRRPSNLTDKFTACCVQLQHCTGKPGEVRRQTAPVPSPQPALRPARASTSYVLSNPYLPAVQGASEVYGLNKVGWCGLAAAD